MNLPAFIEEKGQLAAIYADDGALHAAARILRETAETDAQRASEKDALLAALLTKDDPIGVERSRGARASTPSLSPSAPPLPLPGGEDGNPDDPINLQGSGPAPIGPREG